MATSGCDLTETTSMHLSATALLCVLDMPERWGDHESQRKVPIGLQSMQVESCGIPHLAKNERDTRISCARHWTRRRVRLSLKLVDVDGTFPSNAGRDDAIMVHRSIWFATFRKCRSGAGSIFLA